MIQPDMSARGKPNGRAREALQASTHDGLDDFATLRKDMGRLAAAADKAARAEMKHAGQRLETLGEDLRTRASEGAGYAVEQVRAHPGAAIGLSLGAGLLIGMLLARR